MEIIGITSPSHEPTLCANQDLSVAVIDRDVGDLIAKQRTIQFGKMSDLINSICAQQIRTGVLGAKPFAVATVDADALDDLGFEEQLIIAVLFNENLGCNRVFVRIVKNDGGQIDHTRSGRGSNPDFAIQILFDGVDVIGWKPAFRFAGGQNPPIVIPCFGGRIVRVIDQ